MVGNSHEHLGEPSCRDVVRRDKSQSPAGHVIRELMQPSADESGVIIGLAAISTTLSLYSPGLAPAAISSPLPRLFGQDSPIYFPERHLVPSVPPPTVPPPLLLFGHWPTACLCMAINYYSIIPLALKYRTCTEIGTTFLLRLQVKQQV